MIELSLDVVLLTFHFTHSVRTATLWLKFSNPCLFIVISGLEALHYLTQENRKASFYLEDFDGGFRTANYTNFRVDDSSQDYKLRVSKTYLTTM